MPQREVPPGPLRDELEELLAKHKREKALRREAESIVAKLADERQELEAELKCSNQTVQIANILTSHLLSNRELEESKRREAEKQAQTDSLTGLPNRFGFNTAIEKLQRSGDKGAVLILDADKFKTYNDTHGHFVGDQVLVAIAKYLKTHSRADDIAARWGGDEFIVYFHGATAEEVLDKFQLPEELSTIDKPHGITIPLTAELTKNGESKKIQLLITLSGGIANFDPHFENFDAAFQRADEALYQAKQAGRGQLRIYRPQTHELKRPKRQIF